MLISSYDWFLLFGLAEAFRSWTHFGLTKPVLLKSLEFSSVVVLENNQLYHQRLCFLGVASSILSISKTRFF